MKYILYILTFTVVFTQSLEVEGDLTVTGSIDSQTIDSLKQVIEQQAILIDSLLNLNSFFPEIHSIDFSIGESSSNVININEIINRNFNYAFIVVLGVIDYNINFSEGENFVNILVANNNGSLGFGSTTIQFINGVGEASLTNTSNNIIFNQQNQELRISNGVGWGSAEGVLQLFITADYAD